MQFITPLQANEIFKDEKLSLPYTPNLLTTLNQTFNELQAVNSYYQHIDFHEYLEEILHFDHLTGIPLVEGYVVDYGAIVFMNYEDAEDWCINHWGQTFEGAYKDDIDSAYWTQWD